MKRYLSYQKYNTHLESVGYKKSNEYVNNGFTQIFFQKSGNTEYNVNILNGSDIVVSINKQNVSYWWENVKIDMRKKYWRKMSFVG